jgi:hypothetical protein
MEDKVMPTLKVTTKAARSVWKSPDGQREIFEVLLDYNGQQVKGKTYSRDISVAGFTGDVESYEKEGKQGPETFFKQPAKEFTPGGGGRGFSKPQSDPFTMYLSYAKDLAVASLVTTDKGIVFDAGVYGELLDAVGAGGAQLFASRPNATPEVAVTKPEELPIINVDEPITLSELDKVFGPSEVEDPWKA